MDSYELDALRNNKLFQRIIFTLFFKYIIQKNIKKKKGCEGKRRNSKVVNKRYRKKSVINNN